MRIVLVWVTGIFLITVILFAWYISQPLVYSMVTTANTTLTDVESSSTVTSKISYTSTILLFFNNIWAPILVIIVVIWMLISSQATDPYSRWED